VGIPEAAYEEHCAAKVIITCRENDVKLWFLYTVITT
jgi:hypothetical protein